MGLDMNPLAKPKSGHEAEFALLWRDLNIADGKLPETDAPRPPRRGFWATLLLGPRKPVDRSAMLARFQAISDPHWSLLGAPIIGQDAEADAWVNDLWSRGMLGPGDRTAAAAIQRLAGTHVLELLPDCDGFPFWRGSSGDRCSLRGEILTACEGIVPADLIGRAWEPMQDEQLAGWGRDLRAALDAARAQHGILVGGPEAELATPEGQAGAVDCAARWASFWSARGHGSEPDY